MNQVLRDLINAYLRECLEWQEHVMHEGTHMQWEDLRAHGEHDLRYLPTHLAAIRQMIYEAQDANSLSLNREQEEPDGPSKEIPGA